MNLAIFNSGIVTGYLETEVKTPIHYLVPGESCDYNEIHGAVKNLTTPVLGVNLAEIITQKLSCKKSIITEQYGIFNEGRAILRFLDNSDKLVTEVVLEEVNPLRAFPFEYLMKNMGNVAKAELYIEGIHKELHLLDSCAVFFK